MRSIRLSLILYFLLLLGAALGGVCYFCYQSTQEALAAKETSTSALWKKQFDDNKNRLETQFAANKRRAENKFDDELLTRARSLGDKLIWHQHRLEGLYVLGALSGGIAGGEAFTMGVYGLRNKQSGLPAQIRYDIRIQPPHADDEPYTHIVEEGQFYQTYFIPPKGGGPPPKGGGKGDPFKGPPRGDPVPWETSDTLDGPWQMDKEIRRKVDEKQTPFDDLKLKPGKMVRRVTIRADVHWARRGIVPEPNGEEWYPLSRFPPPGEDRPLWGPGGRQWVYLQYGQDTTPRDKAIALLQANRDRDLAELEYNLQRDLTELRGELDESLVDLRTRFFWIGLGAFAALVVGGFVLVRVGLSPLNRLSDAVSKVSEKDFRLPINEAKLPSELKPIAGRLVQTLEQLKQAFEREKQAAADLSHELRTPVAALLTTLDITLRKQRTAEEYREVLVECRSSGQQIHHLVERLLALARLDAGADVLRPREVDVGLLTSQCVALVRPLAEARGLRVHVHASEPGSLLADPDKLREVLTNLLHNAIEYNKPDGSIEVKVERQNGTLQMEVRDTGIGIAPETRRRIFERFYRADPARSGEVPHAGLGLAIVKGYVDLMGGSIDVDSKEGMGSTFRVRLPVA
jgi:heavy metal sensor kinase